MSMIARLTSAALCASALAFLPVAALAQTSTPMTGATSSPTAMANPGAPGSMATTSPSGMSGTTSTAPGMGGTSAYYHRGGTSSMRWFGLIGLLGLLGLLGLRGGSRRGGS